VIFMKWAYLKNRWLIATLSFLALIGAICLLSYKHEPRYHDSFAQGMTSEWRAYAGNWEVLGDAIRNNSDERGAKFVTGSSAWQDYQVDGDVLLLGKNGDAGIIVRSTDEEEGVDSYSGYYVGLRDLNNSVTIGRADHGWLEYQTKPVQGLVTPFRWYHLKIVAVGCTIAALASDPGTGAKIVVAMREKDCAKAGRIGLRSYSSGGLWKNIRVEPASSKDLSALLQNAPVADSPTLMQTEAGFNLMLPYSKRSPGPEELFQNNRAMGIHTPSLGSLRFSPDAGTKHVTVQGSVVLTAPKLYIEDSSGGIAVDAREAASAKIGDEVEVTGTVEPHEAGVILRNADLRLLWSTGPSSPLSITTSQAATGAFDGMLVEVEGRLKTISHTGTNTVVLELHSGPVPFRALLKETGNDRFFDRLLPNSLLRLRGVCVVDPAYTENLTSYALLLRSGDDVETIAGPPWWDQRYLIEMALAFVLLIFIGALIYLRAARWRMSAVLEERSRMAREIHDTLAQGFAGIALQLESALRETQQQVEAKPVMMALRMARESRKEAHRSIAALRTLHTDQSLENMLRKILLSQIAGTGLEMSISSSGTPRWLSSECKEQVLRIAQETIVNVIHHAMAKRITVNLQFDKKELRLQVQDDGCGFDPASAPAFSEGHFGITGMKERAARIRGKISIISGKHGTEVLFSVPIPPQRNHLGTFILLCIRNLLGPLTSLARHGMFRAKRG